MKTQALGPGSIPLLSSWPWTRGLANYPSEQVGQPTPAATLTFVVAMMARHDVLDLTKACPKIVKQHPHVRLNFITLASVGELEATESAFSRHI
jgi:hypothetical protein